MDQEGPVWINISEPKKTINVWEYFRGTLFIEKVTQTRGI